MSGTLDGVIRIESTMDCIHLTVQPGGHSFDALRATAAPIPASIDAVHVVAGFETGLDAMGLTAVCGGKSMDLLAVIQGRELATDLINMVQSNHYSQDLMPLDERNNHSCDKMKVTSSNWNRRRIPINVRLRSVEDPRRNKVSLPEWEREPGGTQ